MPTCFVLVDAPAAAVVAEAADTDTDADGAIRLAMGETIGLLSNDEDDVVVAGSWTPEMTEIADDESKG